MHVSDFNHAYENYSFGPEVKTPGASWDSYNPGQIHGYHEGNSQWDLLWSYKPSLDKIMITESLTAIVSLLSPFS